MKTPRPIKITPVLNGFICQVGCQTVVFSKREDLLVCLRDYLTNPDEYEKYFIEKAIHKAMLEGPLTPEVRHTISNEVCGIESGGKCCSQMQPPPEPVCQENIHPRDRQL